MMDNPSILIIDDDQNLRDGLVTFLESNEYEAQGAPDGQTALQLLNEKSFDLILTDYKMQQLDGLRLLKKINKQYPSIKLIMITGYGSIEHAVEAMQSGAINYITKPIKPQKLLTVIEDALAKTRSSGSTVKGKQSLDKFLHFHQMVGMSKEMQGVYRKIREVASTDVATLILGESGTGKELVARAIHDLSPRQNASFVPVNTGAVPRELISSELFGHYKGAFTGAISDKKGKFEEANNGTLFLDEISTMSMPVQISLLRVLESKTVQRVGGNKEIPVDVRIICASNEDLLKLMEDNKFREDLYYRLNVFSIEIPPLRERKQDISHLLNYYLHLFNSELNKSVNGFSKESLNFLKNYYWPGNVRELRNIVLRSILSAEDTIKESHLPDYIIHGEREAANITFKAGTPLSEVEKTMIIKTLKAVKGNKLKAAQVLGISRRSLYNKLEDYQIDESLL